MVSLYQLFYSWRAAFVKAQVSSLDIKLTPVLASRHHIPVHGPSKSGFYIPHILHGPVLPHARRNPFPKPHKSLCRPAHLRHDHPPRHIPADIDPFPRLAVVLFARVHLLPSESRCADVVPRVVYLPRSVFALGVAWVFV